MPDPDAAAAERRGRGGRPRDPSRDGVIRAAIVQVLAESGYAALTMDAVAAAAGVGKATIYRRWRTKAELVIDTVAQFRGIGVDVPDTGSLEGDLRALLRGLVDALNSPLGAAALSLLSAAGHEPGLREAFRAGPIGAWEAIVDEVWARAEQRGELGDRPVLGTVVAVTASAPVLQRWLFGGQPVTAEFADEVLDDVVLPLVGKRRAA